MRTLQRSFRGVLAVTALTAATAAQATVSLDFEFLPEGPVAIPYEDQGFRLSTDNLLYATHPGSAYDPESVVVAAVSGTSIELRRADGTSFALLSIDLGGYTFSPWGPAEAPVQFRAETSSGGIVELDFTTDQLQGAETVSFGAEFGDIVVVRWAQSFGSQAHYFDNIVLAPAIPEPTTLALVLAGLAAVGGRARRLRRLA
ncbi:MAG: PEP-CTERM sorting domain-containing protein [Rubrivivax sp.]|nr:PEP-CTERM sorting domain-containing protein [Rubrivivax sp.]